MQAYIYEQKKVGKYTVKVLQDDDPMNPRADCDNLATMICFHRNYNLGDEHNYDREGMDILRKRKDIIWLPLFLYDHSGITMNTTGFNDGWDSSCVGIIYIEKEKYRKEFNCKRVNKKKVYNFLKADVEEYDNYLTGEVYGYIVENEAGENIDSCYGYSGNSEFALNEGIQAAQAQIRYDIKQHIKQVKQWIRNHAPLEKRTGLMV